MYVSAAEGEREHVDGQGAAPLRQDGRGVAQGALPLGQVAPRPGPGAGPVVVAVVGAAREHLGAAAAPPPQHLLAAAAPRLGRARDAAAPQEVARHRAPPRAQAGLVAQPRQPVVVAAGVVVVVVVVVQRVVLAIVCVLG